MFGNPHGRPDIVELDEPQRARLVYHVLVNGIVEVPLILTFSDVGEQVGWNSFLALRDVELVFDKSSNSLEPSPPEWAAVDAGSDGQPRVSNWAN